MAQNNDDLPKDWLPIEGSTKSFVSPHEKTKLLSLKPEQELVYGYCRVSTTDQAKKGHSIKTQEQEIKKWVGRNQHYLYAVFYDVGISGKSSKERLAFNIMIEQAKKGSTIVVASLSRFGRNIQETINIYSELNKKKIKLVILDTPLDLSNPNNFMLFTMLAGIVDNERVNTIAKSKQVLERLDSEGYAITPAEYGWRQTEDGKKEVVSEEIENIEKIKQIRQEYPLISLKDFCEVMNTQYPEIKTKKGKLWHDRTMYALFKKHGDPLKLWGMATYKKKNEVKIETTELNEFGGVVYDMSNDRY